MRTWDLGIALDPDSDLPLFLQISRSITHHIREGRFAPGAALPGSRTLARALDVHRNTVMAAYGELAAEGWVVTEVAGGTFVARDLPTRTLPPPRLDGREPPARAGFPIASPLPYDKPPIYGAGTLVLTKGAPDVRLLPLAELTRAYRHALLRHGQQLLTYGDPHGHPRLRSALAEMLSTARGLPVTPDMIVVTRGSQMALDLTARALLKPGDVVAVEALGHRPAWNALRLAGALLVPVPVDGAGLRIDGLAAVAARQRIRALYVTPHHQFPTTAVMPTARRLELLAFARAHEIAIIEDDYDHEFHYEGHPILPLASSDRAGVVIYVGTLSKILAPGLRIGFVAAPEPVIERITSLRVSTDLQGDQSVECALAELFEEGELARHVRRMRRVYQARRDALVAALRRYLSGQVQFEVPSGGMALWARVASPIDVDEWALRALSSGVAFRGGRMYDFRGETQPFTRLGFTFHHERELEEAVRRMAQALEAVRGETRASDEL